MNRKKILCVDDEMVILMALREQLAQSFSNNEFEIIVAKSASDALEVVEDILQEGSELILVIADYIMPNMKGDELLKIIHEISPFTIKLMLTGQASIEGVSNAINQANLFKLIEKPWDAKNLKKNILECMKKYEQRMGFLENKKLEEANGVLQKELCRLPFDNNASANNTNVNLRKRIDLLIQSRQPITNVKLKVESIDKIYRFKNYNKIRSKDIEFLCKEGINEIENIIELLNNKQEG